MMKCYCLPGLVDIRDMPRMFQEVFPGDGLYSGEPKAQLLEALSRSCCSSVQVCNRALYIGMVPSCILWYETYKKRTTLFHASGLAESYAFNEVQNHSFGLKIFQQCSLVCRHMQFVVVSDREWVLLHRIRWLFSVASCRSSCDVFTDSSSLSSFPQLNAVLVRFSSKLFVFGISCGHMLSMKEIKAIP